MKALAPVPEESIKSYGDEGFSARFYWGGYCYRWEAWGLFAHIPEILIVAHRDVAPNDALSSWRLGPDLTRVCYNCGDLVLVSRHDLGPDPKDWGITPDHAEDLDGFDSPNLAFDGEGARCLCTPCYDTQASLYTITESPYEVIRPGWRFAGHRQRWSRGRERNRRQITEWDRIEVSCRVRTHEPIWPPLLLDHEKGRDISRFVSK